jgi:hypothetical protein
MTSRGATRNPKLREALEAGSRKRGTPNINSTYESCGKLKARNFFMRQDEVFSRRMRGGEVVA